MTILKIWGIPQCLMEWEKSKMNKGENNSHVEELVRQSQRLADLGRYEDSVECLDQASKLCPSSCDIWHYKAIYLDELCKYKEAIKCYDMALKINPNDEYIWNNKGWCLKNLEKLKEADKCFDMALKINPNLAEPLINKGFILHKLLNKKMEALECFNQAIKIAPTNPLPWNNKAAIFMELSKPEEALECYNHALEIDPNNEVAISSKEALESSRQERRVISYEIIKTKQSDPLGKIKIYLVEGSRAHEWITGITKKSENVVISKNKVLNTFLIQYYIGVDGKFYPFKEYHTLENKMEELKNKLNKRVNLQIKKLGIKQPLYKLKDKNEENMWFNYDIDKLIQHELSKDNSDKNQDYTLIIYDTFTPEIKK